MAKESILLGSGDLFIADGIDPSTATEAEIDAALVKVGEISSGASLNYESEFKEIRGGRRNAVLHTIQTSETVTFSCGIVTWDMVMINKFVSSSYSEDAENGTRRLGIGGLQQAKPSYLRFVHYKEDGKTIKVNMFKAQNQSGISLAFNSDDETILEYEFKLLEDSSKADGNLVEIIEEI